MQFYSRVAIHGFTLTIPAEAARRATCRMAQVLAWCGGAALLLLLVVKPRVGLHAVWDVVLPLAPGMMAIVPGVWRNICPLGTTSQLARHAGRSLARPLSDGWQIAFQTTGLALLLVVVPLRHVSFNLDAFATFTVLAVTAGMALAAGVLFSGKSGWCSGLCPVHPVEKLYGQAPAATVKNAHCATCIRCTAICADSTRAMGPLIGKYHRWRTPAACLLVGGFPGYIWGWFHIADDARLTAAFALPFGGMCGVARGLSRAHRGAAAHPARPGCARLRRRCDFDLLLVSIAVADWPGPVSGRRQARRSERDRRRRRDPGPAGYRDRVLGLVARRAQAVAIVAGPPFA